MIGIQMLVERAWLKVFSMSGSLSGRVAGVFCVVQIGSPG
jgi:hypothetical protein